MADGKRGAFAWSVLDRLTPTQLSPPARARLRGAPRSAGTALAEACTRMLGRPVSLDVVETWTADELPSRPGDLSIGLSLEDTTRLVLSVDSSLAIRIASLVAGHPLERVDAPPALEAEVAGGATAFLVVAARYAGAPWRLSGGVLLRGPFACLRAAVSVGEDVFEATAAVPLAPSQPPASDGACPLAVLGVDVDALASLGDMPLSLPVVVAITQATDADLAALAPGAAWVPGETWMARRGQDGTWRGTSMLAAPFAQAGLVTEADASGQWSVQTWRRGDQSQTDGGVDDGSSVVRVEVGPITLAAREWARLVPGAPLPLPFGDVVMLRVGGLAVASGRVTTVNGEQVVLLEATREDELGKILFLLMLRLVFGHPPQDIEQPIELWPDVGIDVAQVGLGSQPTARTFGVGAHVDGSRLDAELVEAVADRFGVGRVEAQNDTPRTNDRAERLASQVYHQGRLVVDRAADQALSEQTRDVQRQPFARREPARFGRAQDQPRRGAHSPRFARGLVDHRGGLVVRLGYDSARLDGARLDLPARLFEDPIRFGDDRLSPPTGFGDGSHLGSSARLGVGRLGFSIRAHELGGQHAPRQQPRHESRRRSRGRGECLCRPAALDVLGRVVCTARGRQRHPPSIAWRFANLFDGVVNARHHRGEDGGPLPARGTGGSPPRRQGRVGRQELAEAFDAADAKARGECPETVEPARGLAHAGASRRRPQTSCMAGAGGVPPVGATGVPWQGCHPWRHPWRLEKTRPCRRQGAAIAPARRAARLERRGAA
jgi:hypothetical protein